MTLCLKPLQITDLVHYVSLKPLITAAVSFRRDLSISVKDAQRHAARRLARLDFSHIRESEIHVSGTFNIQLTCRQGDETRVYAPGIPVPLFRRIIPIPQRTLTDHRFARASLTDRLPTCIAHCRARMRDWVISQAFFESPRLRYADQDTFRRISAGWRYYYDDESKDSICNTVT